MIDRQPEEDGGGGRGDGHPFFASNSAGIVSFTNNRTNTHMDDQIPLGYI